MINTIASATRVTRVIALSVSFVCWSVVTASAAEPDQLLPWEGDFFEAAPADILHGVQQLPDPDPERSEFILTDDRLEIDDQHRTRAVSRRVYRILSREDVEQRGSVRATWTPWIQDKPIIRARVITPDGKEHRLDPKTIAESAGENLRDQMYLDHKALSAPLPAVDVGSVIETEVISQQHTAFCPEGIVGDLITENFAECHRVYIELSADQSIGLKLFSIGKAVPLELQQESGRSVWRFDEVSPEPIEALWAYLPADVPLVSYVTYCTGKSWTSIAAYYHRLVEEQIKDASMQEIVAAIKSRKLDRRETIRQVCAQVFEMVRYTGIEFGINKIQPHTPEQTLQRRYGDCKDQTAFVIAMLRELDIQAHAALLNVSSTVDIAPDAPGLNAFDHVIVYVPKQADLDELWIDMTAPFTSFGRLPQASQNRLALIAATGTDSLKKTPGSTSKQNHRSQAYVYKLGLDEPTRVTMHSEVSGVSADSFKAAYASQPKKQIVESASQNFKAIYGLTDMIRFDFSDCHDTSIPNFIAEIEFEADEVVSETDAQLTVELHPGAGFKDLPYDFVHSEYAALDSFDDDPIRTESYHLDPVFSYHTSYHVIPPKGFVAGQLPDDYTINVAGFTAGMRFQTLDDHSVRADVTLDTGDGNLSIDQVERFCDEFLLMTGDQSAENWTLPINFYYLPRRAIDEGDEIAGIREMLSTADSNPASLFNRSELATALLSVGLGEEARELATTLVKEAPESNRAHRTLGWIHLHNLLGEDLCFGMDRSLAIESFARAVDLEPNDAMSRYNHAMAMEFDDFGGRYTNREAMKKAAAGYQWFHKNYVWDTAVLNHAMLLAHLGDKRQLRRLITTYPDFHSILPPFAALEMVDRGALPGDRVFARAGDRSKPSLRANVVAIVRSLRRYDRMREYLDAFPDIQNSSVDLDHLKKYEEIAIDAAKPESALQELIAKFLESGQDIDSLRDLYTNCDSDADFHQQLGTIPASFRAARTVCFDSYGDPATAKDIVSFFDFTADGNEEHGYLVTASPKKSSIIGSYSQYIVRDQDRYRVLAEGEQASGVGKLALKLIDEGKLESGRVWLDRIYAFEKQNLRFLNPFSAAPFAQIRSYCANDDRDSLRLAALCLASRSTVDANPIDELMKMRDSASAIEQLQIDRVRLRLLYRLDRYDDLLSLTTLLLKAYPDNHEFLTFRYHGEVHLEKLDDAEATLQALEAISEQYAMSLRRELVDAQGGHQAVFELAQGLYQDDTFPDYNGSTFAWRSLFIGKSEIAIQAARDSVNSFAEGDPRQTAALHTLACVYADAGQIRNAVMTLRATIDARNGVRDPIDDWVLGRIAEHCGLVDAARKYYSRVAGSSRDRSKNASCAQLAQLRLQALTSR